MTKQAPAKPRHRFTTLVHLLYAAAVVAALLIWLPAPIGSVALILCNALPLIAYVLDVWHSPKETR